MAGRTNLTPRSFMTSPSFSATCWSNPRSRIDRTATCTRENPCRDNSPGRNRHKQSVGISTNQSAPRLNNQPTIAYTNQLQCFVPYTRHAPPVLQKHLRRLVRPCTLFRSHLSQQICYSVSCRYVRSRGLLRSIFQTSNVVRG